MKSFPFFENMSTTIFTISKFYSQSQDIKSQENWIENYLYLMNKLSRRFNRNYLHYVYMKIEAKMCNGFRLIAESQPITELIGGR